MERFEIIEPGEEAPPAPPAAAPNNNRRKTIVFLVILTTVVAISLTLGLVLSRGRRADSNDGGTEHEHRLDTVITETGIFPNGSFLMDIQRTNRGPIQMAPIPPNASTLAQVRVSFNENDYKLAEAGRLNYFYVLVPPDEHPAFRHWSVGLQFGNENRLNLVPRAAAEEYGSGLRELGAIKGLGTVYEIQVRMPESLCTADDDGECYVTSWRAYVCSRNNESCVSSANDTILAIPCGSQCGFSSSVCATSTCRDCDGPLERGADAAASRRFNLDSSSGVVQFRYETNVVKNRVRLIYEGKLLYDSGCVGTNGFGAYAVVRYEGTSKEMRVDVEPKCEGGGTSPTWWFNMSCLFPCKRHHHGGLLIQDGYKEIVPKSKVPLTEEPAIPPLTVYYCPGGSAPAYDIQWNLTIFETPYPCRTVKLSGKKGRWNVDTMVVTDRIVQGGDATLSWIVNGRTSGSLNFTIVGSDPHADTVVAQIRKLTALWYAEYVARRESGYRQFDTSGYPLIKKDGRFGIFQLTPDIKPTCAQLWNWRRNVEAGVQRLINSQTFAIDRMNTHRLLAKEQIGYEARLPRRVEANCVFEDDTNRTIEDAVAMKAYYDTSSDDYCRWDNETRMWKFNPEDSWGTNYVNTVCFFVPKTWCC